MVEASASAVYIYNGNVSQETKDAALREFNKYKSDREPILSRIKDNERYFRSFYERGTEDIKKNFLQNTPLIFSCIENSAADASENYPVPNILERDPAGTDTAQALSKIIPAQLELSNFRAVYDENSLNKLKYGTAVYGVFYNEDTDNIDIRSIDLFDIYVDVHLQNIQDSRFLFIAASVDNDVLKEKYPEFEGLFTGDATVETVYDNYQLSNRSQVIDCYYKKPDGALHMMKLCHDTIIAATEDMDGYDDGLYAHGKYPVVFDTMFPIKNCPYGFGFIDIGKPTQILINKLEAAITENIKVASKQRYFSKRNGGINVNEFSDLDNYIVHVDGDISSNLGVIQAPQMNQYAMTYLKMEVDYLKEILGNRDFQQGGTSGGVTAASAIQILRETGEKRSRKMANETYRAYKDIVYMAIELMRQFSSSPRTYRIKDETGKKTFIDFSSDNLFDDKYQPIQFDIEVVPQVDNPYSAEMQNQTVLTLWNSGFFLPSNAQLALAALKNMSFKTKSQLINDIQNLIDEAAQAERQTAGQGMYTEPQEPEAVPAGIGGQEQIPIDIAGLQGQADVFDATSGGGW